MADVSFGAIGSGLLAMIPSTIAMAYLERRLLRGREWSEVSFPTWLDGFDSGSFDVAAKAGLFGGPILGYLAGGQGFTGFLAISDARWLAVSAAAGVLTWIGFTLMEISDCRRVR